MGAWIRACIAAVVVVPAGVLSGCADPRLPESGRYAVRGTAGVPVSTDCLGPGQPDARGSWPGDDAARFRFMPPGCATATAIARMVVDPGDLLRGRPLPPGAALPVARAIERYYNRSLDAAAPAPVGIGAPAPAPGPAGANAAAPSAAPSAAPATAGDSAAGLLQGPLSTSPTAAPAPGQ